MRGSIPIAIAVLVGALAASLRVVNLDGLEPGPFGNEYDEGAYLGQLDLMVAGFRPFREIYTTQGPLLLHYFYPFYALSDGGLAATRLGAVLASVVSLLAIWLIAWQLAGLWAAAWALLLAATSTVYLQFSRMVLAEIPSIAPALLAIALADRYRGTRTWWYLYASAILFAAGLLLKPMTVVNGVPILVLLGGRVGRRTLSDVAIWTTTCLLVVVGVVLVAGPTELLEPFLTFRRQALGLGAAGQRAWSVEANLRQVATALRSDPPWLVLGCASLIPLWRQSRHLGTLALCWAAAAVLMLALYSPIASKHAVYVVPPMSVLGGLGLAAAGHQLNPHARRLGAAALVILALAWWLPPWPTLMSADRNRIWQAKDDSEVDPAGDTADVLRLITTASTPEEYIITDDHWLAYLARRKQPPRLADLSLTLIRAGLFRDKDLIGQARDFRPSLILFWANRTSRLTDFGAWVAREYVLIKQYDGGRAVYLRGDLLQRLSDFGRQGDRPDMGADFGPALTLEDARILPGPMPGVYAVEQNWRARQVVTEAYVVTIELRIPESGAAVWQREDGLLPSWHHAPWPVGGTLLERQTANAAALSPGRYLVTINVRMASAREPLSTKRHADSPWDDDRRHRFIVLGEIRR